jgi:acyl carrier protein
MTAHAPPQHAARLRAAGIDPIQPERGFAALDYLLSIDNAQAIVFPVKWDRFLAQYPAGQQPPFFGRVAGRSGAEAGAGAAKINPLFDQLKDARPSEREELILELLREETASVLGFVSAGAIESNRRLMDLGLDSMTALELKTRLEAGFRVRLSSTLIFDYPTLIALAGYLSREVYGDLAPDAPPPPVDEAPADAAARSEIDAYSEDDLHRFITDQFEQASRDAVSRASTEGR